jgi:integrase
MYSLEKARISEETEDFYYVICLNDKVVFPASRWLKRRSFSSIKSASTYGSIVVRFLNFLLERKVLYWNASAKDMRDFFTKIIEFDNKGRYTIEPNVQKGTIDLYDAALTSFYKHLTDFYDNNIITTYEVSQKDSVLSTESELTTRWDNITVQAKKAIDLCMPDFKVTDKEYIKEYTDEEIQALYASLRSAKLRAIFVLTLYGLRIDEVLSIKLKDYDPKNSSVKPSRSKGRKQGNIRVIKIGTDAIQLIEAYLLHERKPAELIAKKTKQSCPYLFVNTRLVHSELDYVPYTYTSYRSAFLRAAKRAGISKDIRTHTGRSHRAIELLRMANEGIVELTDEQIRLIMGWRSMESAEPYIEVENKRIADIKASEVSRKRIERLDQLKQQQKQDLSDE